MTKQDLLRVYHEAETNNSPYRSPEAYAGYFLTQCGHNPVQEWANYGSNLRNDSFAAQVRKLLIEACDTEPACACWKYIYYNGETYSGSPIWVCGCCEKNYITQGMRLLEVEWDRFLDWHTTGNEIKLL